MTELPPSAGPRARLQALRASLKRSFLERDEVVDGALAALLAREHVLLVGPVGTAKSMLAQRVCEAIDGARLFTWLLTKFSTPEELFGPVSLKGLEHDQFRRLTAQKLPEAHIAFLDEIFKANSAILNSLLAILNERVYHNGAEPAPVPLQTLFGASNELPEEGELVALYDRFLVRFEVEYLQSDEAFLQLLNLPSDDAPNTVGLSLADLEALQVQAQAIAIGDSLRQDLVALRGRLNDVGIEASDRRYRRSLKVLRAYAMLEDRSVVNASDFAKLEHLLWTEPQERPTIAEHIQAVAGRYRVAAADLVERADEQRAYALRYWSSDDAQTGASVEALAKLRTLLGKAEALYAETTSRDDDTGAILEEVRAHVASIINEIMQQLGSHRH